jgi:ligand-binding SRPBCC domain-containing protein
MSWIHISDLVRLIQTSIENEKYSGVFNASTPNPTTNSHLTNVFAKELGRFVMPAAPKFCLQLALGEVSAVMLQSARLDASRIEKLGFKFDFSLIENALSNLCEDYQKMGRRFFMRQWVPLSKEDTFAFFSDHMNLEVITPPKLQFKVLGMDTPKIQSGSNIDYKLKLNGIPFKWRTRIDTWNPIESFSDTQIKGPYAKWHHTHSFEEMGSGTMMTDLVRYRLPMGYLGRLGSGWYVDRNVRSIFNYRFENLEKILSASA